MSSLEEQLALFEKEVLSVTESSTFPTTQDVTASSSNKGVTKEVCKADTTTTSANIGANTEPTRSAVPRPSFTPIGPSPAMQPASMKFVPTQLRGSHPIANFMRPPHFPLMPPPIPAPVVIQSGPTLYSNNNTKGSHSAGGNDTGEPFTKKKKHSKATVAGHVASGSSGLKTMVLPSDVELMAAKRQAAKSHDNSYLGQVMRGEKKMKRFVRTGGGQIWEDPSLAEWDPNDFRIFCGDLGNEVSDELLAKAFRKYPSFQKAKVVRDNRTNKSKGYGFVSFKHQDDFIRACREMDGKYVGNRPIKLRKSNWKERNLEMVRKKDREKKKLGLTM